MFSAASNTLAENTTCKQTQRVTVAKMQWVLYAVEILSTYLGFVLHVCQTFDIYGHIELRDDLVLTSAEFALNKYFQLLVIFGQKIQNVNKSRG